MEENNIIPCFLCKVSASFIQGSLSLTLTQDLITFSFANIVCPLVAKNATVCPGIIGSMKTSVIEGLVDQVLNPHYFCEHIFSLCTYKSNKLVRAEDQVRRIL